MSESKADPVLEAVAELVFADLLVDVHELVLLSTHSWFSAYRQACGLELAACERRLMVAHDDPVIDADALRQLAAPDQVALLDLLADITTIDDHPDPREIATIQRLAESLGHTRPATQERLTAARERTQSIRKVLNQPRPAPSRRVRALRLLDRKLGQEGVDRLAALLHQSHRIRTWRRRSLFNHKGYGLSLQSMHQLTLELMPQTLAVLETATSQLTAVQEGFADITTNLIDAELPSESRRQLQELINSVRESLDRLVTSDLTRLNHDLQAKQRSLNRFCIAAVGRTKAGKSTLMASLTGRDPAAIGDGRQGFTRYNRAYDFFGIRLIDTPGIGAAGGQGASYEQAEIRDSDVARGIFAETDLVCFVMDNDSTMPCTREMMRDLHARGKAFLILLNVKAGMRGGLDLLRSRLEALFAREGEQSISGNIAAIRRDLASSIGVNVSQAVPIIPIHAKAAFKATQISNPVEAEPWRKLSRVDHFLEALDELITARAPALRRDTLRRNPQLELEAIGSELKGLQQQLTEQAKVFEDAEASALKSVIEIFDDTRRLAAIKAAALFTPLELQAQRFSKSHLKKNVQELERLWKQEIEKARLTTQANALVDDLKTQIGERLQQLQEDLQDRLKFQMQTIRMRHKLDFNIDIGFEETMRLSVKIGLIVVGGIVGMMSLVFPPFALLWLAGGWLVGKQLPNLLDNCIPGRDERRRVAQEKLCNQLLQSIKDQQGPFINELDEALVTQRDQLASSFSLALGSSKVALLAFAEKIDCCHQQISLQASTLH
jgi:GTP-binding protein EngB required for normal cell division